MVRSSLSVCLVTASAADLEENERSGLGCVFECCDAGLALEPFGKNSQMRTMFTGHHGFLEIVKVRW